MFKSKIFIFLTIAVATVGVIGFIVIYKSNPDKASSTGMQAEEIIGEGSENRGSEVPTLTEQDIIRNFYNLINEDRIDEAFLMMSPDLLGDTQSRQDWTQQFQAINNISVTGIEPWSQTDWSDDYHTYKASINADVGNIESASIPDFGWDENPNIRWVSISKGTNSLWQIANIATGP